MKTNVKIMLLAIPLLIASKLHPFTVINDTDLSLMLRFQEAWYDRSECGEPISCGCRSKLNESGHLVLIAPHSVQEIYLEDCDYIRITYTDIERFLVARGKLQETINHNSYMQHLTNMTLTNECGIYFGKAIHNHYDYPADGFPFDSMLLHPDLPERAYILEAIRANKDDLQNRCITPDAQEYNS